MTARPGATMTPSSVPTPAETTSDGSRLYLEGFIGGLVGAATVALWFLIVDSLSGRPLFTPTVLGTALFRHGAGLASPETLPVSFEMVWMFTWVHGLAFVALGGIAARLLALAEREPSFGFGIMLLCVVFEFGFIVAATALAAPVLQALTWSSVFTANLLAAIAMVGYFRRSHPGLRVSP